MPETQKTPKNPGRVAGGREAMRRRWGPPRTIDLSTLPAEQRAAIVELVEVARKYGLTREGGAA